MPEDYREFIASFRLELEAAIRPFDGYIAQYSGDGLMAYFGYPQSSDYDAEKAVTAGLAIIDTVKRMPPFGGRVPRVRIGIATGLTVVGAVDRSREFMGESAVGEAPNLAARLQVVAAPNAVVVAAATRQLIGGVFDCGDLGEFELKGFDRPVRAWQVHRRASAASRFDALRTGRRASGFIGREAEDGAAWGKRSPRRAPAAASSPSFREKRGSESRGLRGRLSRRPARPRPRA